jgi:hypothetical protein
MSEISKLQTAIARINYESLTVFVHLWTQNNSMINKLYCIHLGDLCLHITFLL